MHTIIKNIPEMKFQVLVIACAPMYINSKYITKVKIRKIFELYSFVTKYGYTAKVKAAHSPAVFPIIFFPKKYKATIVKRLKINSIQQKNVDAEYIKLDVKPNFVRIWTWDDGSVEGIGIFCLNVNPKNTVPISRIEKIGELIAKFFL